MWRKTIADVHRDPEPFGDSTEVLMKSVRRTDPRFHKVTVGARGRVYKPSIKASHRVFRAKQILRAFHGGEHKPSPNYHNLHCADVVLEIQTPLDALELARQRFLQLNALLQRPPEMTPTSEFYGWLKSSKGELDDDGTLLKLRKRMLLELEPYRAFLSMLISKSKHMYSVLRDHTVKEVVGNPYLVYHIPIRRADLVLRFYPAPEDVPMWRHMAEVRQVLRANESSQYAVPAEVVQMDLGEYSLDTFCDAFRYVCYQGWVVRRTHHEAAQLALAAIKVRCERAAPPLAINTTGMSEDQVAIAQEQLKEFTLCVGEGGTGKTFFITRLIEAARLAGYSVVCLAFMGAAVQNLKDVTTDAGIDVDCLTIHSFIANYKPNGIVFKKTQFSKKPLFVIVDEIFMAGALLLARLFRALGANGRLATFGDPMQLDPVLDFPLLASLVSERLGLGLEGREPGGPTPTWLPVSRLTTNHRAGGDELLAACRAIRDGEHWGSSETALILEQRRFSDHVFDHLPQLSGRALLDFPQEFLYISPTNDNVLDMNNRLRSRVNPTAGACLYGDIRMGDLLMLKKNVKIAMGCIYRRSSGTERRDAVAVVDGESYGPFPMPQLLGMERDHYRLYNSQLAVVREGMFADGSTDTLDPVPVLLFRNGIMVRIKEHVPLNQTGNDDDADDDEDEDPDKDSRQDPEPHIAHRDMVVAYARTIHRSQGSQGDYVYINGACAFYHRRLLYTALSRTKKKAKIYEGGRGWVTRSLESISPLPVFYVTQLAASL